LPGRKPKPTAIKQLAGNPGHRPLNASEPRPAPGAPDCPDHLDDLARREWERVCAELVQLGVVTRLDRAALAAYCQSFSLWSDAAAKLKKFGTVVKGPTGLPVISPFFRIADLALKQMHRWAAELGLGPSSRSRIHVTPSAETDPLDDFLDRRTAAARERKPAAGPRTAVN
jgi:P27 family predicted phage terminase small subunit